MPKVFTSKSQQTGEIGENVAVKFLMKHGFSIIERNYTKKWGEIDIIKEERRNGYAEEAVRGLIKWAFSNKIVKEITAKCSVENVNSIDLLRKINFIETDADNEMIYWTLKTGNSI